jgi:prepilin-type N-terminal cleavage/methylation domain-containing protein
MRFYLRPVAKVWPNQGYSLVELLVALALASGLVLSTAELVLWQLSQLRQWQQQAQLQRAAQFIQLYFQHELSQLRFQAGVLTRELEAVDAAASAFILAKGDCDHAQFAGALPDGTRAWLPLLAGTATGQSSGKPNCLGGIQGEFIQWRRLSGPPVAYSQLRGNRLYLALHATPLPASMLQTPFLKKPFLPEPYLPAPSLAVVPLSAASFAAATMRFASQGKPAATGAQYWRFQHQLLYVQPNASAPALMKKHLLRQSDGSLVIDTQTVLDGVEQLAFEFGIDRNQDGLVDEVLTTPQVPMSVWRERDGQVRWIRFYALLRSLDADPSYKQPQQFQLAQQQIISPADGFRRLLVVSSVLLHN